MEKSTKKSTKVNMRKYVNYALLMVAVVLVALIASKFYGMYKDNKLGDSVFNRMVANIQFDDIDSAMTELPTDGFILISYTKNQEVKDFEAALKKSVVNNELQNNFYYMDVTDMMLEDGYINTLNKKFNLEDNKKIEEVPAIIYYKDGKLMTTLTSTKDRMINVDDFSKMLDSYEVIGRD